MTALDIVNLLKSTRDNVDPAVLWLNHERREAAVHPGCGTTCCVSVTYDAALVARSDPALNIVYVVDGETLAA